MFFNLKTNIYWGSVIFQKLLNAGPAAILTSRLCLDIIEFTSFREERQGKRKKLMKQKEMKNMILRYRITWVFNIKIEQSEKITPNVTFKLRLEKWGVHYEVCEENNDLGKGIAGTKALSWRRIWCVQGPERQNEWNQVSQEDEVWAEFGNLSRCFKTWQKIWYYCMNFEKFLNNLSSFIKYLLSIHYVLSLWRVKNAGKGRE